MENTVIGYGPAPGAPSHRQKRSYLSRKAAIYFDDFGTYRRDAFTLGDLLQISRVRLALSKIGKLACPTRIAPFIRLRSFGPQPLKIRSHTTDISVLNEILVSESCGALLRHPRGKPRLIVDLGANTGLVDRWLLNVFPGAEIIAVEPEPGNAATLRANVSSLPVRVLEACVGATPRTVTLHTSTGEHGFTMVGDPGVGEASFEVPVVTMETVLQGADKIDILKVDIEGAEEELFSDCAGWIAKVGLLMVECHGDYKVANLLDAVKAAGSPFRVLELDASPGWPFETALLERIA